METIERRAEVAESTPTGIGRYHVLASSPGVARDGFSIAPDAWQLGNFQKNPVLTWAHAPESLPLGTVPTIDVTIRGLEADIEFSPEGINPFADQVHALWRLGILRAVSVGAALLEPPRAVARDDGSTEHVLDSVELNHLAIVPVGSDPDALAVVRGLHFSEESIGRLFHQPPTSTTPSTDSPSDWRIAAGARLATRRRRMNR